MYLNTCLNCFEFHFAVIFSGQQKRPIPFGRSEHFDIPPPPLAALGAFWSKRHIGFTHQF
jgi:hypothetical protein